MIWAMAPNPIAPNNRDTGKNGPGGAVWSSLAILGMTALTRMPVVVVFLTKDKASLT